MGQKESPRRQNGGHREGQEDCHEPTTEWYHGQEVSAPHDLNLEKSLLASMLLAPGTVDAVKDILTPSDFYPTRHQQITSTIFEMHGRGEPVDLVTAGSACNGQATYLAELVDHPIASNVAHYARKVAHLAQRRKLWAAGHRIVKLAMNGDACDPVTLALAEIEATRSGKLRPKTWDGPLDLMNLLNSPPSPTRWLVRDRIPQGRGIIICGTGGSSKTRLVNQLAVGCRLGRLPWDWQIEATGRALLVLTEDTPGDVHRTIYNICKSMELTADERKRVFSGLIIYPLAGKDCCLLTKDSTGALVVTDLYRGLERKIIELEDVQFVGLDPALSLTEGDEMAQGDQRKLGREVDNLAVRTGATVALVAHAPKASLNREELESHNSRGGGSITDVLRAEFSMRTMTASEAKKAGINDIEERKRHVQLVATKGNVLPASAYFPVWFRRDDTGTLEAVQVQFTDGANGPTTKDLMALDVLKNISEDMPKRLDEWRSACVAQGVVTGTTPDARAKSMQRTIKKLAGAGMIIKGVGKGVWLTGCENEF